MSSSEPEAAAPLAQSGHDDHGYVIPCKKIKNPMTLGAWEKSQVSLALAIIIMYHPLSCCGFK